MKKIDKNKMRSIGKILAQVGLSLLILLAWLAFFSASWYIRLFGDTGFDSILYTLMSGLGGVESGLVVAYLLGAALPAVLCALMQVLLIYLLRRSKWKIRLRLSGVISLVLSVVLLVLSAVDVGMVQYIYARAQLTNIYEEKYVDPNTVQIQFPEQKRNLIYIVLESMETTYLDEAQGGAMDVDLIPELTQLAQENVNFSHNEFVGGLVEIPGATWSVGAIVAQTGGVPLITPSYIKDWHNGYGKGGSFLPGLTTMSNILAENGYYQTLMMGCDAGFGGESTYALTHQVDKVYDLYTARKDGLVPEDYYVWWGFEDKYLFEYARQELTQIAAGDQPFAFTVMTMDTHRTDGYICSLCGSDREETFDNVLGCASRQVAAFVQWIQEQPFYENTTIVITGDHFTMDSGYILRNVGKEYVRHGYNCIINAPIEAENTKNRLFSSLDMFPTTLAALGCQIEGDQLGFGVNLFSDKETMLETYGYDDFCWELRKRTDYYPTFYEPKKED